MDVWINNAGVGAIGCFEAVPLSDHEQVIKTNFLGTLCGTHVAFTQFRKQGAGILINTASLLGKIPAPYYASYNASKHDIIGLSATLRNEVKLQKLANIHICTVLPMAMDTPFFDHAANYTGHDAVPLPPTLDAERVIDAIVALVHKPQDEVIVGPLGSWTDIIHALIPDVAERIIGQIVERVQMKAPETSPLGDGSVFHAVAGEDGIHQKKNRV